jgi:hypothetical protein
VRVRDVRRRDEVLQRRVLREEPVPVVPAVDLDGVEEVRLGGRGQQRRRRDLPLAEYLERPREDVDGADEQPGVRLRREVS